MNDRKYATTVPQFLGADDMERLRSLADGQAPLTEDLLYVILQTMARGILGEQLGASGAVTLKK